MSTDNKKVFTTPVVDGRIQVDASSVQLWADAVDGSIGTALSAIDIIDANGPVSFFDTKEQANEALAGLDEGAVVEVFSDESRGGLRTRYRVESSALVFKVALGVENEFDTLALAIAAAPSLAAGTVVKTLGHSSPGDGKGFLGVVEAEASEDYPGGGSVRPTTAPYNVLWWGVGEENADNHAQIESALRFAGPGGAIFFPPGHYLCSEPILLTDEDHQDIQLLGQGTVGNAIINYAQGVTIEIGIKSSPGNGLVMARGQNSRISSRISLCAGAGLMIGGVYRSQVAYSDFLGVLVSECGSGCSLSLSETGLLAYAPAVNAGGTVPTEPGTITSPGSGYPDGQYIVNLTAVTGTGTKAKALVTVVGGALTELLIVHGGDGYAPGDQLTISGLAVTSGSGAVWTVAALQDVDDPANKTWFNANRVSGLAIRKCGKENQNTFAVLGSGDTNYNIISALQVEANYTYETPAVEAEFAQCTFQGGHIVSGNQGFADPDVPALRISGVGRHNRFEGTQIIHLETTLSLDEVADISDSDTPSYCRIVAGPVGSGLNETKFLSYPMRKIEPRPGDNGLRLISLGHPQQIASSRITEAYATGTVGDVITGHQITMDLSGLAEFDDETGGRKFMLDVMHSARRGSGSATAAGTMQSGRATVLLSEDTSGAWYTDAFSLGGGFTNYAATFDPATGLLTLTFDSTTTDYTPSPVATRVTLDADLPNISDAIS